MRDLLALDARDFAAVNGAGSPLRTLSHRSTVAPRATAHARRSGATASETTTMIVVLVAWALITGYLFAHVAEGAVVAATEAPVAAAVAAAHA
jgi:hypothetical protein